MCNNTTVRCKEQEVFALVMATPTILSNALLLVAFKLKWRAITASKVYIMALAVVCLLGGIADFIIAVVRCQDPSHIDDTCFIGHTFNGCASLLLVAMAMSRWARRRELLSVSRGSERCSSQRRSRHRLTRLWTVLCPLLLGSSTVRGAKIISAIFVVAGTGITLPLVFTLCRTPNNRHSDCTTANCTNSTSAKDYGYCQEYRYFSMALLALMSIVSLSLYAAVLGRQCADHFSQRRRRVHTAARRPSSVFFTQQSCDSLGSLFDPYGCSSSQEETAACNRNVARTRSEGDTSCAAARTKPLSASLPRQVTSPFSSSSPSAEIYRCDTNPVTRTELGWLRRKRKDAPCAGAEADAAGTHFLVLETAGLPPVAYSAQLRSLISLNMERSRSESEGQAAGRRSECSLPAPEVQRQGGQTTLIFLAMTLIHVACYFAYFGEKLKQECFYPVYLISTLSNPIVYCLGNRHFRAALFKLLVCRRDII